MITAVLVCRALLLVAIAFYFGVEAGRWRVRRLWRKAFPTETPLKKQPGGVGQKTQWKAVTGLDVRLKR